MAQNCSKLVILLVFQIFCTVYFLSFCSYSFATPAGGLTSQYVKLRNSDPKIEEPKKWVTLAQKFETHRQGTKDAIAAASSLYSAAVLYESVYLKHFTATELAKATSTFELLVQEFEEDERAPRALLKLGDLYLYHHRDVDKARAVYRKVVYTHSNSPQYKTARERLASIGDGKYLEQLTQPPSSTVADSPSQKVQKNNRRFMIVLDPGHGGEDEGAVGLLDLHEKEVVLDVTLRLEALLKERLGATVRLTRRDDQFIPLVERTNLANDFEADLFVSVHSNASKKGSVNGIETYYLDDAGDKSSKKLAQRENLSGSQSVSPSGFGSTSGDLSFIISDLIQSAKTPQSVALAHVLQESLVDHIGMSGYKVRDLGVKLSLIHI